MTNRTSRTVIAGVVAAALAACAALGSVAAEAETSALSLLRRVVEEGDNVSFRATQTVILWYPTESSACITNVVHKAPNLTRTEYLPSATSTSSYRVVVSDGQSTWHFEPSLGVVFYMPGDGAASGAETAGLDPMALIEANYVVTLVATETLAGRKTHVIELEPRHGGNPSRKIWVDAEFPFILRMEKYRPDGPISSLSFYNHIDFHPTIEDDAFLIRVPPGVAIVTLPGVGNLMSLEELQRRAGFTVVLPEFVPDGYVLEGGALSLQGNARVAHVRFTDGLNTISYFVAPPGAGEVTLRRSQSLAGSFDAVSSGKTVPLGEAEGQLADYRDAKLLMWRTSSYAFTLIGEVDESLLVAMAKSVPRPRTQEPARKPFAGQVVRFFYQFFWVGK